MKARSIVIRVLPLMAVSLLLPLKTASAGPYGDSLAKCVIEATTSTEKTALVRWMFSMMALHPDVKDLASISADQRTTATKDAGRLLQRLLTESCAAETSKAVKYEGAVAIQTSFSLLGQVAARELFLNSAVAGGLSDLEKHVDQEKLKKVLEATEEP